MSKVACSYADTGMFHWWCVKSGAVDIRQEMVRIEDPGMIGSSEPGSSQEVNPRICVEDVPEATNAEFSRSRKMH